jgi:N,N'-diacetyllegionaminate synthase
MSGASPARIRIGDRWLGAGEPCYVIAEAGSNHNGSLAQARALIDVAADAGADAVKFQGFRARTLYPETAGKSEYLKDERSIYDIIQAMELPLEWLPALADHCRARGVDFLCTPFDEAWVEALDPYVPAFKVASYELSHLPLVRKVLERRKPTFISTGASGLAEVLRVVELARAVGNERIVLLQCTAAYPTPPADVNARAIVTLREATGCHVGLSDHSRDPIVAPVVAVTLGAVALEKHFTLSNSLPGPDQRFAVEPGELKDLVRSVRQAQAVLGTGVKEVLAIETELHGFARRSVFSVRAIKAGEVFSEENIRVLRNGAHPPGLPPEEYPRLLGGRAACDIAGGRPVTCEMVRREPHVA